MKTFLDNGINPDRFSQFSHAARDTADVLGIKLSEAAGKVGEAFTGDFAAVAALDDKMQFLTATQREHIRTLFEEGKAEDARTYALDVYSSKMSGVAEAARGPWSGAARELSGAWKGFIDYLSNLTPIVGFQKALENLAGAAKQALHDINSTGDAAATLGEIADKREYINGLKAKLKANPADQLAKTQLLDAERGLQTLITRYNELAKAAHLAQVGADGVAASAGKPGKPGDTVNGDPNSVRAKQRADKLADISLEDELQRLRDAGQTRVLNAHEAARRAELAGLQAAKGQSDEVVAAALKRKAITQEMAAIERSNETRSKAALQEREAALRQFESRVIAAEGGTAKNPYSSAKG